MQDNYVGDIGDYGKYGLLRNVTAAGLQLAVNWYRVVLPPSNEQDDGECISCSKKPKQKDGKYTSYLEHPEKYRHYDPELFDCLAGIVHGQKRRLEEVETSGVLSATFFSDTLNLPPDRHGIRRHCWPLPGRMSCSSIRTTAWRPQECMSAGRLRKSM